MWQGTSGEFLPFQPDQFRHVLGLGARAIHDSLAALICHGVFDRHPRVRVASIENGSKWVFGLIDALSHAYGQMPREFSRHPRETLREHVYIAPFYEEPIRRLAEAIGIERVLFGSYFPHPEGLARPLDFLPELDGFSEAEKVRVEKMPELELYVLHKLGMLDVELRAAAEAYEFNRYARALSDFMNEDLSAFFFDIRKDCLYCDAPDSVKRRAYRTVLDTLFHALVRYAAPILAFTAEEVWQARYPSDDGSVNFLEWPELPPLPGDDAISTEWADIRRQREAVTEAIEPLRRAKTIRSSLEANVTVPAMLRPAAELAEVFIVADVQLQDGDVTVARTDHHKCGRCWRLLPEVEADGALCHRCAEVAS